MPVAATVQPFVCGGLAACFASSCIHPIDLAKVRTAVRKAWFGLGASARAHFASPLYRLLKGGGGIPDGMERPVVCDLYLCSKLTTKLKCRKTQHAHHRFFCVTEPRQVRASSNSFICEKHTRSTHLPSETCAHPLPQDTVGKPSPPSKAG